MKSTYTINAFRIISRPLYRTTVVLCEFFAPSFCLLGKLGSYHFVLGTL